MEIHIVLSLLSWVTLTYATSYHQPSPWWAKPITSNLSTAGCLTDSQLQEAKDAGFNSIVSMFNSATEEHMAGQHYPSTSQEESAVRQLGMDYEVILNPDEFDWMTISTLERFGAVYPRLRKPVLFHCISSYSATFISLLYLVNSTRHHTEEAVTMDAMGMLTQTTSMGFDYSMDEAPLKMLREVSGIEDLQMDNTPDLSNPYWNFGFWPMKPILKNWYLIGQLHPTLLQTVKDNGIGMVIHVQSGTITQQTGTNIDQTTFSGTLPEEKGSQTQTPRPDPRRMECTETGGSPHDHLHDVSGHVDELAAKVGITYWNLGIDKLNASVWLELQPKLLKVASQHSGILVHGDSTQNTVLFALLAAGCQHGRDSTWAREVMRRHGYYLDTDPTDAGDTHGSVGHVMTQLRRWSPLLSDVLTPLAELVGVDLHQVPPNVNNIQADDMLTAVLDHRDTMC